MKRIAAALVLVALLAVACSAQPSAESVATAIVLTEEARPTATPSPEPTATATPVPSATPLTPTGIFESLSPAVVHIESDGGFGSGVLIEGNYVLTNAHVVWPATDVIVTFTDGTRLEGVPVAGTDLLADLALLGPVETSIAPLPLVDGESLAIGSPLLLIGYPGTTTGALQPTLTETLISRLREQETFGITYFQVSAPVAGGQSGGIAVTLAGDVVGLTGNRITEAQYGLIASAADILPRIAAMQAETDAAAGRGPDAPEADDRHFLRLHNLDETRLFVADLAEGTELEVSVDGVGDAMLVLIAPVTEESVLADETSRGIEQIRFTVAHAGRHYLLLAHNSGDESYTITSNVEWTPYLDPDDGQQIVVGESYDGVIDAPFDVDIYNLALDKNEVVNVRVSSVMVDPTLLIEFLGQNRDEAVGDDDSGGGLFDTDAEITYQAPHAGLYHLVIIEPTGALAGGYRLEVRPPGEGAPTPTVPEPTPTPIASPFGELTRWESQHFPFALAYPAIWNDISDMAECPAEFYSVCMADLLGQNFIGVIEGEVSAGQSLDEMAQGMQEGLVESMGVTFMGREEIVSAHNQPAVVLSFADEERSLHVKVFVYMLQSDATITVVFVYTDPELEPLVDHVFTTFEVTR